MKVLALSTAFKSKVRSDVRLAPAGCSALPHKLLPPSAFSARYTTSSQRVFRPLPYLVGDAGWAARTSSDNREAATDVHSTTHIKIIWPTAQETEVSLSVA